MPDYGNIQAVQELLKQAQEVDIDQRRAARDAHLFIDKRDGQWEPRWWDTSDKKPRYTFDMTGPIVDQVSGELEQADFDIKVKPAGGDASKETALLYDGLIRNIENISGAQNIYNMSARNMITAGIDGWRIVQKYADDNSFDQDLIIEAIGNFVDRVWFDPAAFKQDMSDARYCFVLQAISRDEYKERWPEGSEQSVSQNKIYNAYYFKDDTVVIGQIYYIKKETRTLHLMSDGRVLEEDDDFESVQDELAAQGVTIERSRKRQKNVVYSRLFDSSAWLNEEQRTVFSYIPVIPTYGNFKVFEDKVLYRGVVEKLMDAQRVYNYSLSREIEEGALAPRAKYWMTREQAAGNEAELRTLNTNTDPVQFYNVDSQAPGPPQQQGGAQINPGLRTISEAMRNQVGFTAGLHAANMGDNPGLQSGVAIEKLQSKGDTATIKYFSAQEVAICHTARILVDAIPSVYDAKREVRILGQDGSFDVKTLNETVRDEQTGELVTVNDLSQGLYDVTCSAGPAFQNKQQETVSAIVEMAQVDPSIVELGGDILVGNVSAPGMEQLAARKRSILFQQGLITPDEWTDEEKQQVIQAQRQAAQQGQQPDAAMVLAEAEMVKAKNEQAKTQIDVQEKSAKIGLAQQKEQRENAKFVQSTVNDRNKLAQSAQQQQHNQSMDMMKLMLQRMEMQLEQQNAIVETVQTQAETLKTLREAIGVDAMVGPSNTEAYIEQAEIVQDAQDDLN